MSSISETITIQGRNHYEIPIIYTRPMDEKIHPCVILLHGTCSNKNEVADAYVVLANELANYGYATFRFDFVGNGESQEDHITYSLKKAIDDTHDVMDLAKEKGYHELSLLGWSQGGTIAMLASDASISSVITLSGAINLKEMVQDEDYQEAKVKGYSLYDPGYMEPVKLSLEWFEDVLSTDVLEEFSAKKLPTLAIHGTKDDVVDPLCSKKIVDASHHEKSRVIYMDDCDHIYNVLANGYAYFSVVCEEIIKWLDSCKS